MKVVISSVNPIKIKAVGYAFNSIWPEEKWEVNGLALGHKSTGQPETDEISISRAKVGAEKSLISSDADYAVSLDCIIQKINGNWFNCGWVVVINKEGKVGYASTPKIMIPKQLAKIIQENRGLTKGCGVYFKELDLKQDEGLFGFLTNLKVKRIDVYKTAFICALENFIHDS